jgi:hypothetical protein
VADVHTKEQPVIITCPALRGVSDQKQGYKTGDACTPFFTFEWIKAFTKESFCNLGNIRKSEIANIFP